MLRYSLLKVFFGVLIPCAWSLTVFAQQVKPITSGQLEARFKNGQDTVYIVNFWATWCSPCIKELPAFEQIKQASFKKPVKVVLISTDEGKKSTKAVEAFVSRHHLTGEIYQVNESPNIYLRRIDKKWTGSLPATLVVSATGKRQFYNKPLDYKMLLAEIERATSD